MSVTFYLYLERPCFRSYLNIGFYPSFNDSFSDAGNSPCVSGMHQITFGCLCMQGVITCPIVSRRIPRPLDTSHSSQRQCPYPKAGLVRCRGLGSILRATQVESGEPTFVATHCHHQKSAAMSATSALAEREVYDLLYVRVFFCISAIVWGSWDFSCGRLHGHGSRRIQVSLLTEQGYPALTFRALPGPGSGGCFLCIQVGFGRAAWNVFF